MNEEKLFVLIPRNVHSYNLRLDKEGYITGFFYTHSLKEASSSLEARKLVYEYLDLNGFDNRGGFFNSGPAYSFRIGGANSGYLVRKSLSTLLWNTVHEEIGREISKAPVEDFYKVANEVFKKYFPDLSVRRNPVRREPKSKYGRFDDAMIVNDMLWERLVKNLLEKDRRSTIKNPLARMLDTRLLVLGGRGLPDNEDELKKEVIGEYWIVLVSYVRNFMFGGL